MEILEQLLGKHSTEKNSSNRVSAFKRIEIKELKYSYINICKIDKRCTL